MTVRSLKSLQVALGVFVFALSLVGSIRALSAKDTEPHCIDQGSFCEDFNCFANGGECDVNCVCQLVR